MGIRLSEILLPLRRAELLASCQMWMVYSKSCRDVEYRWRISLHCKKKYEKQKASAKVMQLFCECKNDKDIQFLFNL